MVYRGVHGVHHVVYHGICGVLWCVWCTPHAVVDPGGAMGAMAPPSVPDNDYLLCTSWHFLVISNEF